MDVQKLDLEQLANVATEGGIEALTELADKGEFAKADTPAQPEPPAQAETPAQPEAPRANADQEETEHAKAVATKDGKGTIPYSVLKGARERASTLQSENEILRKQVEELAQRATQASTPVEEARSVDEMDQKILNLRERAESLKSDFPELADMFTTQADLLAESRKEILALRGTYQAELEQRQAREARSVEERVQEAIDGNPTLSQWQSANAKEWTAAVNVDAMLRQQPDWAEKSFAERFEKVVEMVRVMHPDAEIAPAPASQNGRQQASPSKADKPKAPAFTLSDIPGGVSPAASLADQIGEMSSVALARKFGEMSPDQLQEYMASLAM